MKIRKLSPGSLSPYEDNVKHHSDAAVARMAEALDRFGWTQPIVTDKDRVIIVGHRRWLAALLRSLSRVPVVIRDDLSPEQVRALRLLDNRLDEDTATDKSLLKSELKALEAAGLDLSFTGFTPAEVSDLFGNSSSKRKSTRTASDSSDRVRFSVDCAAADKELIVRVLKKEQLSRGLASTGEALIALCMERENS